MRKKKFAGVGRIISYGSLSLLGLFAFALLFPIARSDSYATCTPDSSAEECMAMPASTEVGVTTSTVISLALDNQVQMEVVPKSSGTTSYASTKLNVSTNSNDGYAIYLQTGSETGSLTGVTTNLMGEISNTAKNNVTLDKLGSNSYGYALSKTEVGSNTTYSHIPTSSTIVESTTGSMASGGGEYAYGDTYYLAFGTKIDTNLPAGQYAGTVTVSAVANPTTLRSMYDLTYMQDMTSDICTNTKEHYTKQLIDTRDGKSYWVAKLKDGNCWMVQNLALDLDVNEAGNAVAVAENGKTVELNEGNTDIDNIWKPNNPETFRTNAVELGDTPAEGWGKTASWNFGQYVNIYPGQVPNCGNKTGDDPFSQCSVFANVDGWTSYDTTVNSPIIDESSKKYNAHYIIGNFYNFSAVTAETDSGTKGSICPSGWVLPQARRNSGTPVPAANDFYELFLAYGYPEAEKYSADQWQNPVATFEGRQNIFSSPMYFVRTGTVYSGGLSMSKVYDYASGTSVNETYMTALRINDNFSLSPGFAVSKLAGIPARCLVRQ